jgi:GT2 family glycosyltransferase
VAFPAFKREIFDRIGLFNEELVRNQDDEFSYRLRKTRGRILLAPDIRSRYYSRGNFKSLWRQYFQYGYWKVRVLQLHPKQMSVRQFVPLAFVSTIFFLLLFAPFSSLGRWSLLFVLGLYVFAALTATFLSARRIEIAALPAVFLSFVILHFSYGLGFCAGLIKFCRRWRNNSASSRLVTKPLH